MRRMNRILGLALLCFGLGVLMTFFFPVSVLIIVEAIVIILMGFMFIRC